MPFRKFRLRTTLVVAFVTQIVGAVSVVGYLSFKNGQKAVDDLAHQLMAEVSLRIDQRVDTYLAVPRRVQQLNLRAVEAGTINLNDFQSLGRLFWNQVQTFGAIYIDFRNQAGTYIGAGYFYGKPEIAEVTTAHPQDVYSYLPNERGDRGKRKIYSNSARKVLDEFWYTETVAAGKTVWSSVYSWASSPEEISVGINSPLRDRQGRLLGVMGIDYSLSQISQFLRSLNVGKQGKAFIIERSGKLVATSSREPSYEIVDNRATQLDASRSNDPLVKETATFIRTRFGGLNNIHATEQLRFSKASQQIFVQVTPDRDEFGLNWLIVVALPEADFMGKIDQNTELTTYLSLVALAIAAGIGIFTARRIAHPILKLTQASEEMAGGNLDQYVEPSWIVELEKLANSFNIMSGKLKESFNILEQKNQDLQKSEARNQAFLNAIPDLILRISQDGIYLDVVDAKNMALLVSSHDRLGKRVQDVLPPELATQYMQHIQRAIATGEPQSFEYNLMVQDTQRDYEARVVNNGSDEAILIVRDITDRKRAEAALRLAEENYRSIVENALQGIFQSTPDGHYISVNSAMARMNGYNSPDEMIASVREIGSQIYVDPSCRDDFKQLIAQQDRVQGLEYQVYRADGSIMWVEECTRAVRDTDGRLLYYEGIVEDITDRKHKEAELKRQLTELQIEIDQQKRAREVAKITQSNYFQELKAEAEVLQTDTFWE